MPQSLESGVQQAAKTPTVTIEPESEFRRILEHLGRWVPEPAERAPPAGVPHWPANAVIPLSYNPLLDIA